MVNCNWPRSMRTDTPKLRKVFRSQQFDTKASTPLPRAQHTMSTFTQESNKKAKIPSTAIDILNNDTAKLYTHIHPIIVLSLYAFKFPSIVKDPVPALTNTLIWLGILQIAYAAICLPPTGGGTASAGKSKPGEKRKKDVGKLENNINATIIVRGIAFSLPSPYPSTFSYA